MRLTEQRWRPSTSLVVGAIVALLGVLVVWGLLTPAGGQLGGVQTGQSALALVLTYALPTFLAGVFSFLSPCTLPILPAYFAFTFQANRQQIALMTLAFFLGLATTMTLFGATASIIGTVLIATNLRPILTLVGGIVIMGLGVASMLGKGFSGMKLQRRPSTTFAGTYVYGMTFALGWSACVGPILGTLFTTLVSQGTPVLAGAVLAQVYALGLALPLFLITVFFRQLGTGSRAWAVLRGRGYEINVFGRTLYLHSTSLISGLMLVVIGYLLASGQMYRFSQVVQTTNAGELALNIETWLSRVFGLAD